MDFYRFRQQILESHGELELKIKSFGVPDIRDQKTVLSEITFVGVDEQSSVNTETDISPKLNANNARQTVRESESLTRSQEVSIEQQRDVKGTLESVGKARRNSSRKTEEFICDKCGRVLKRRASFLSHFLSTHLKQHQRKKCPYCPRLFTMSAGCK